VVRDALSSSAAGWQVDPLIGRAADANAVADALRRVDLLHYAGHATVSGAGGWESALPLAGQTRLTLGDLLASPRVPTWVVLSGCETGRTAAVAPVATLGLAHAFLLAGARGVVATSRPVTDRTAEKLLTELYGGWNGQMDLSTLLRQAQLAVRHDPATDWQSFRFYEP
jgi:CHAT domain-containing protein